MNTEEEKKYHAILKSIERYVSIDKKLFLESQKAPPHISIKLNTNKIKDASFLDFQVSEKIPWAQDAYYLTTRPAFYADPLFYAGAYYVMDSSSMFLEEILKEIHLPKNSIVLDVAAAPGGKSVLISNYLNEKGLLWSNEINYHRAQTLHYNLSKWGKSNYVITNHDSGLFSFINETFDLVVCDAPCTGSGLFRKYPEWIHSFNENLVQQCVSRQKQILQNIFSSIKINGYLVYSTCSFMSEENEDISKFILENGFEYININIHQNSGILKTEYGIRFFPHLISSEGFFYAVFQKKNDASSHKSINPTRSHSKSIIPQAIQNSNTVPVSNYISFQDNHQLYKYQNKYFLSNSSFQQYLPSTPFKFLSIGTYIGDSSSHIPAPELANSLYLKKNIPTLELTKADAQKYLKKEPLQLSGEKNIYLMSYKNLGLGWAKLLENRINNYFPSAWRILKEIENNLV